MIAEAGQSIIDIVLQQYGTVEALFALIDDNTDYFTDEITRIPLAGDEYKFWNNTKADVKLQRYFSGKKINTGMLAGIGGFTYQLTPIAPVEAGYIAALYMTVTNTTNDYITDYVTVNWGGSVYNQSFVLQDNGTTEIESYFVVPFSWNGIYNVVITGAISVTTQLEVINWVLTRGVWNDAAGWRDDGKYNDNFM